MLKRQLWHCKVSTVCSAWVLVAGLGLRVYRDPKQGAGREKLGPTCVAPAEHIVLAARTCSVRQRPILGPRRPRTSADIRGHPRTSRGHSPGALRNSLLRKHVGEKSEDLAIGSAVRYFIRVGKRMLRNVEQDVSEFLLRGPARGNMTHWCGCHSAATSGKTDKTLRLQWQVELQGKPIYHNNMTRKATTKTTKKGGS